MVDMRQGALSGGGQAFHQAGIDRYQGLWTEALGYKGGQPMPSLQGGGQASRVDPEDVAAAIRSGYNTPQSLAQALGISTAEATQLLQSVGSGQGRAPAPAAAAPIQRVSVPSFGPQQGRM